MRISDLPTDDPKAANASPSRPAPTPVPADRVAVGISDLPPDLKLREAAIWIMLRDAAAVSDDTSPDVARRTWWHLALLRNREKLQGNLDDDLDGDGLRQLERRLRAGQLQAWGVPGGGNRREEIPSAAWRFIEIGEHPSRVEAELRPVGSEATPLWTNVTVRRDQVLAIWPPIGCGSADEVIRPVQADEGPRPPGRPGVRNICERLFRDRRDRGIPFAGSQLEEARAILRDWPGGVIKPPIAKTISGHIAGAWRETSNRRRKL
jgi:hypothetical protein